MANQEFMSVTGFRAYKLSNPAEADQLERDVCLALKNRINEADICEKYDITRSVISLIKDDNGLVFKGPLAGASAQTIAAHKLYERQCHAKGENPLSVKDWRVMFESKEVVVPESVPTEVSKPNKTVSETTVRGGLDANETRDAVKACVNNAIKNTPADQLPFNFEKENNIELKDLISSKIYQMLLDYPRLGASLESLAKELAEGNSGKFVVEYTFGKTTNIAIEYKD